MNINASKEHKKDTSRIIRSNNKLLDSSREANRNKYAHTIQCRVPYSEFEEPHPIAETGSYSPHADDSIFVKIVIEDHSLNLDQKLGMRFWGSLNTILDI